MKNKVLFGVVVGAIAIVGINHTISAVKNTKRSPLQILSEQPSTILIPWTPNYTALPKSCKVEKVSGEPYIVCIYDFVSDEEAEFLKRAANPLLHRSAVVGGKEESETHPDRTSTSAFLNDIQSDLIDGIRKRTASFLNTKLDHVEQLQVVHYQDGQKYNPHFDYFDRALNSAKEVIGDQGQRIATLLVYLNDVKPGVGGETFFPKVLGGLKVQPKKNMAVFWFNVLPNGLEDDRTLHGGLPIAEGEKWAMNIWIRDPRLIDQPTIKSLKK